MLDVILFRSNEIEIYDTDLQKEAERRRSRFFFFAFLAITLLGIITVQQIYFSTPSILLNVFIILLSMTGELLLILAILENLLELKYTGLSAMKLYFNKQGVERLVKLNRISLFSDIYSEQEVRMSQAIGLRIIEENHMVHRTPIWILRSFLTDEELYFNGYIVEIVYDMKSDGIPIFRSYDAESIQELILTIRELIPNIKNLEFKRCEKVDSNQNIRYFDYRSMSPEVIQEFNDPRVTLPKPIREFLKEKYKLLK